MSGSSASNVPPRPDRPHVVIVGAGFGGLAAARALRSELVDVTVIDRRNYHLFQPLLYQVATAALSPGDIASPIRWVLRRQRNARVLLAEANELDPARSVVKLDDGSEVPYDFVIVATGATHSYFGHDEWALHAPGLKSLDDALEIRRRMLLAYEWAEREGDPTRQRQHLTFVVVGGGPTGVEMAGAITEVARQTLRHEFRRIAPQTARVLLVEAGPTILPAFAEDLRDAARASLRKLGIEVREGVSVTRIDDDGAWLGDERVRASTVVWAAGVAASPLGRSLGVPTDKAGRVIVDPELTIPSHRNVFVIGDLARLEQDGEALPGVAPVAQQQARHAVRNIVRAIDGQPLRPFHYRDPGSMATIGRASAVAEFRWAHFRGFIAWLMWLFIHIMQLVGFRNRIAVLFQWAGSYLTFQRSVRLITGDDRRNG